MLRPPATGFRLRLPAAPAPLDLWPLPAPTRESPASTTEQDHHQKDDHPGFHVPSPPHQCHVFPALRVAGTKGLRSRTVPRAAIRRGTFAP
jgi:hypothetical protein